jgi:heme exporter protein D
MPGTNLLVLFGLLFYLGASLLLWKLLLKEPPRLTPRPGRSTRPPRWPIRLAKTVATALGGAASGGVSLLLIAIIVNAGKPGTMSEPIKWGVWTMATVLAILFIGRAPLIRRVVTRTCLVVGLQGVLLPLATLASFVVAGARLAGSAGTGGERTVDYMGLRLAGHLPTVWIGVGGFCVGLALLLVSDRVRRRATGRGGRRRRPRAVRVRARSTRVRPR